MPKPNKINDNEPTNMTDANETRNDASQNGDANGDDTQQEQQYVTMQAFEQMRGAMDALTGQVADILGGIKAIKDAQSVMVRNGVTIIDDTDPEPDDEFLPLTELDFTFKK